MQMSDFPSLMLCQDCLQVRPYSESAHFGEWRCHCGGDFCGCNSCNDFALGKGFTDLSNCKTVFAQGDYADE